MFGGGRMLLHIEEEHELPTPSTWMECSGIIFPTTMSNVSTDTLKLVQKMYYMMKQLEKASW